MKLVLLGTNGYHPNETRHTACVMLPELGLLLDAGTGLFRIRDRVVTPRLDIYLSHAHLDHVAGLTFLLGVLHQQPIEKVVVHGEAEKLDTVRQHLFADLLFPVPPRFELRPLEGTEQPLAAGGTIRHFPVQHPGGAVGYRLDLPDRSLAYVTDTTAAVDADYLEHIRGVDILLHECNFPDELEEIARITGHSWTTAVAQVAKAADVGMLVLTHLDPAMMTDYQAQVEIAQKIFPNVIMGEDNMELQFD